MAVPRLRRSRRGGRQVLFAAGSSQAWQAQAHRVTAGKCNYNDDICACATRGKWTALRIVDAWNAKRRAFSKRRIEREEAAEAQIHDEAAAKSI